jgi:hypothetical protein
VATEPSSPLPPEVAEARARTGAAFRRLGHHLAGHHVDAPTLDELAEALDEWASRLGHGERRSRVVERPTGDWGPAPADGAEMFSFDERPISGRSAPYGLDLRVFRDGHEAIGHLVLGPAHEGAPGRSHGGILSALFDDVFGFVLTIEQQPAFTGELTIRYEAGVPIGVPLECRVRLTGRDGRKLHMNGELTPAGDPATVYTRARATFIAIDPQHFGSGAD